MDVDPLVVPTGPDDRLTGAALRAALDADPDADAVCAVVATAGTTNTGTIDDLTGVADVAHERDVWVHVDGAYGLAGLAAPSVRDRFRGIERVDSFVVDPHKWLFAPFDCAALLYRDPAAARRAHAQHAPYLDPIRANEEWNPADYAYHLTRRVRGPAVLVLARGARHRRVPRRDRGDARDRAATRPRSIDAAPAPRARARPGAHRRGVPPPRLGRRAEPGVVRHDAARPARVRAAHDPPRRVGAADGVPPPRVPAVGHRRRRSPRSPDALDADAQPHAPHRPRWARRAASSSASIVRPCTPFGGITSSRA